MEISVEHHDSVGEYMYCISVSKLPTQVTVSIRVLHVMGGGGGVTMYMSECILHSTHLWHKQKILAFSMNSIRV